jgi:hypothetical protein
MWRTRTPRGGPYPHLRLNKAIQLDQAAQAAELHFAGHSFRQIGAELGMSPMTAWRRVHWWLDATLPRFYGQPIDFRVP